MWAYLLVEVSVFLYLFDSNFQFLELLVPKLFLHVPNAQ
jgi:hypothetical protein